MAGVKGRSGGPRANSGGSRPGAGRKPKPPETLSPPPETTTAEPVETTAQPLAKEPLSFLLDVMNDPLASPQLRVRAAVAAAQYVHVKKADGGKKEETADAAKKVAASGRFKATAPPKLVVSNR